MYERQEGTGLEIGSYAHRPITLDADDIPSIEESALSPTELPFTQDDFDPQMEQALELMPEIVGDETVGVKYAINGVLSVTYDGMPLLGETPEVRGLWSAAAIWIKEGPGAGKTVAELIVHGESEIDVYESNIARAYPSQKTRDAHRRPRLRGLQQDVRDRPSRRAVGLGPQRPAVPVLRAGTRAGRRLLRRRRLGAPAVVRVERGTTGRVRRPDHPPRGRVGLPLVVADHQRRAPGHARPGGDDRPERVRHLRRDRPGRARRRPTRRDAADERRQRPGRVHAAAHPERRLQAGPDDHAPGRRHLPRGHRRRLRDVRPQVVRRPPPARTARLRSTTRPTRGPRSACGVRAPATSCRASRPTMSRTRGFRSPAASRSRSARCRSARVAHLLRGRPGLGAVRPDRAGRPPVGPDRRGRRAARDHPGRDRRVRHHRTTGEVLPRLRRRARGRVQRGRGRHGLGQGQGRGLRRQGGPPAPPRGGTRRDHVHPDRRRSHVGQRGQALHAGQGADPHARRAAADRPQGPPLLRHQRRRRPLASASTS